MEDYGRRSKYIRRITKQSIKKTKKLKQQLLATRTEEDPLSAFCKTCRNLGYELYEMELIAAGEEFHAAMKRSTNGGGENSPMIKDEDDFYELFFANLEEM